MKKLIVFLITTAMLCSMPSFVFAASKTAVATVSFTVSSPTLSVTLGKEGCSAPDATKITLVPDTLYPSFLIAPNRADMDAEKNWHYVQISATKTFKLEIQGTDLTGPATISINKFRYWYSGTYAGYDQVTTVPPDTKTEKNTWVGNEITKSPTWEKIYDCASNVIGAKSYLQYQLDIGSAPAAGNYTGTITYQVTDTL